MEDVEHALSAINESKTKVLAAQRKDIDGEIVERRLTASDTTLQVEDELREVNTELLNLAPAHENASDTTRKERIVLEKEKHELTKEEREEQRDTWKDV